MATGKRGRTKPTRRRIGLTIITAWLAGGAPGVGHADVPPPPSSFVREAPSEPREDMTEEVRAQVGKIVVVATRSPAEEKVSGSYDKNTYGLLGGAAGMPAGSKKKSGQCRSTFVFPAPPSPVPSSVDCSAECNANSRICATR